MLSQKEVKLNTDIFHYRKCTDVNIHSWPCSQLSSIMLVCINACHILECAKEQKVIIKLCYC